MKYMLLIHQGSTPLPGTPEWEALSPEEQGAVYAAYGALNETPGVTPAPAQMAGPETATTVRVRGRPHADHRRPVRRAQGGHRRLPVLRGRRPRRRDRAGRADPRREHGRRHRDPPARGVLSGAGSDSRAGLPRPLGPRAGRPDRLPRRLRPRRGGRAGGLRDGRRALAARRRARASRRVAGGHRAQPGHRPHPPRPHAGRQDAAARRARGRGGPDAADDLPRRAPRARLHLLSPGAGHRGAGGADPAHPRRAEHRGDRARVPRSARRRWPSASCAPSARSAPPASRSASRPRTCCPTGWPRCWPSST